MEKNRSSKVIAIVALVVAVLGLSLGFAAFSNTLVISSNADVKTDPTTFKVVFSSSDTSLATEKVDGVASTGATAGSASIVNGTTPTISDLSATFTAPGQTVTYTFYAHNSGEYEAFLKNITYANVSESSTKVCTAKNPETTTGTLLSAACQDISVEVKVGTTTTATGSVADITKHSLAKGDFEPVVVTIKYADNDHRSDGDFTVEFGDISLVYKSSDA